MLACTWVCVCLGDPESQDLRLGVCRRRVASAEVSAFAESILQHHPPIAKKKKTAIALILYLLYNEGKVGERHSELQSMMYFKSERYMQFPEFSHLNEAIRKQDFCIGGPCRLWKCGIHAIAYAHRRVGPGGLPLPPSVGEFRDIDIDDLGQILLSCDISQVVKDSRIPGRNAHAC